MFRKNGVRIHPPRTYLFSAGAVFSLPAIYMPPINDHPSDYMDLMYTGIILSTDSM